MREWQLLLELNLKMHLDSLLQFLKRLAFTFLPAVAAVGCVSTTPMDWQELQTTQPVTIDARSDNAALLALLGPGLLVALEIDGERISPTFLRVMLVQKNTPSMEGDGLITLTGLSHGKPLTTVKVSDSRLNVREDFKGKGETILLDKRTVTAVVPLPARIDVLEVRLPGKEYVASINVKPALEKFCESATRSFLCYDSKPAD